MSSSRNKTRKTVIFIVEGVTDKDALENIFKKIYKFQKEVVFTFTRGDITSDENNTINNICDKIYKFVKKVLDEDKLKKSDVWQIVHIFDTDGAYIDDSLIKKGEGSNFVYTEENIFCSDTKKVLVRNKHKREITDYLLEIEKIKGISYTCYYFSSNLDHALYNKLNLSQEEKQEYADEFYGAFVDQENLFIEFLKSDVVNGVPNSFIQSWKYIKESPHSLERHTNLHLYFNDNPPL